MSKRKSVLSVLLVLVLLSTLFAGCGQQAGGGGAAPESEPAADGGSAEGETASGADTSEQVELNIWTFGASAPRDMDMVNEAASKITLEELNCTVNVQVMADWGDRYSIVLSSGEPVDMIWTAANWGNYQPYALDGAFVDITDMVPEVAPELYSLVGEDVWNSSKIGGRSYAIPCINKLWGQWGVAWREDLRKKYNVPEINSWETMEAYAEAIVANEPGMIPFCDSPSGGLWHSFSEKINAYVGLGNPQFSYGLGVRTDNPRDLFIFHETPEFLNYVETNRRWVENGYVQPDVASSVDQGNAGMLAGKYAGSIQSQGTVTTLNNLILPARDAHPDWEIGYMNFGEMFKWTYQQHPIFMAYALPKACPNPERTLLFAQELMTNKELFQIYDMGIEGTHYELDGEGFYVSLNDPLNPGYLQSAAGITTYLYNESAKVYSKDYDWVVQYEKNNMEPYAVTNFFEAFPEDYSSYRTQQIAIAEIADQYTYPMILGAVPDPAAAVADSNSRLDAAGRQEVVENVKTQFNAYLDSIGVE